MELANRNDDIPNTPKPAAFDCGEKSVIVHRI
jgi:hypothetical protein